VPAVRHRGKHVRADPELTAFTLVEPAALTRPGTHRGTPRAPRCPTENGLVLRALPTRLEARRQRPQSHPARHLQSHRPPCDVATGKVFADHVDRKQHSLRDTA
jgi:hypothetical protein